MTLASKLLSSTNTFSFIVEEVFRSRIAVEDRSLKRCLQQLSAMCRQYAQLNPDKTQQACMRVLQEVRLFRHTVQVAAQTQSRCEQEINMYSKRSLELESTISEGCSELGRMDQQLEESRSHKRHKIAYDEIAVEANKKPTRDRLAQDIDRIKAEIEHLKQEEAAHEETAESLRSQYWSVVGELGRLNEMAKTALNEQDQDIYIGDGDDNEEDCGVKIAESVDISPATPRLSASAVNDPSQRHSAEAEGSQLDLDHPSAAAGPSELSIDQEDQHTMAMRNDVRTDSEEEEGEYGSGDFEDEEGELLS